MAKDPVLTAKKLINLDPAMLDRVSDFRFTNRINTESEALRLLLEIGLDHLDREAKHNRHVEVRNLSLRGGLNK
jgi:hypothetical protein